MLDMVKRSTNSNLIPTLMRAKLPSKLAQIIVEFDPVIDAVISLLTRIILLTAEVTPELTSQSNDVLRTLLGIPKAAEAAIVVASHFARISESFLKLLDVTSTLSVLERSLPDASPSFRARSFNLAGNVCKYGRLREEVVERMLPLLLNALSDEDEECRRNAAFALGNMVFHAPEIGAVVADHLDQLLTLLESNEVQTVDHVVGVLANLIRVDDSLLPKLIQAKTVEKIMKTMVRSNEFGKRVIRRLPMFCKYQDGRKILKTKVYRLAIVKYTNNQVEESIRNIAQSIVRILDAFRV
jgi:hypothetical protein